jgi:PPM family protein phosphatase
VSVKLTVVGRTDVGKVRTNNEDNFVVADLARSSSLDTSTAAAAVDVPEAGMLFAVSDGMGGEQAGEVASALVVESLRREVASLKEGQGGEAITKMIDAAVMGANKEVYTASKAPGRSGMGATLTAVFVLGDTAFIAEVGDSRAYLIRAHRIRQMTRDQSFVQLLVDAGALSEDEAKNYPHKNVILQAMGQKPEVKPAIGKLALRRFDKLLLCSDGLSNKVKDTEMREIVETSPSLEEACKKLIALANERGGEDNITVVLAELSGDGLQPHKGGESVTQTYEIVRDFAQPNDDAPKPPPAKPPPAPPEPPKPAEATDEDEDDDEIKPPPKGQPGDLSTRPQQMVVAAIIIGVMLWVLYTIVRGK